MVANFPVTLGHLGVDIEQKMFIVEFLGHLMNAT